MCDNVSPAKIQVCGHKEQHCVFVKDESDSPNKYSDSDSIQMVELFIDDICG